MNAETTAVRDIELRSVTKGFGPVVALRDVHLQCTAGDVVAVMGRNGAGKSTLLSLLAMETRPSSGEVRFNGEPTDAANMRAAIGYLSHAPLVCPDLTCRENLEMYAALYGCRETSVVESLRARFSLDPFWDNRTVRTLSKGQLQRVALARTVLSAPTLLLMDEPTSGLDAEGISLIRDLVAGHRARDGITILVTHDIAMVTACATRIVVLAEGAVAADRPGMSSWQELSDLLQRTGPEEAKTL